MTHNVFNITVSECYMTCVVCTSISPHDDVIPILYFCCSVFSTGCDSDEIDKEDSVLEVKYRFIIQIDKKA